MEKTEAYVLPSHTIRIEGQLVETGRRVVACKNCGGIVPPNGHKGVYSTADHELCSQDCLLEFLTDKLYDHFRKGGLLNISVLTPEKFDIADTYETPQTYELLSLTRPK